MRIKRIAIDGFGVWRHLTIDQLADGITVVFGPNEAGKTTVMQFIRAMLYGGGGESRRYLPPVGGGEGGGLLEVANEFGGYQLHRRWASTLEGDTPEATLTIVDDRGEHRDPSQLATLLAGVDEATFQNVFAVGLKEIQELGSLDDTAAADYLYRLTSGLDRVSLIDVVREVSAARQRLWNEQDPATSRIAQLLAQRKQLDGQLERLRGQTEQWLELAGQRRRLAEQARQLDARILELESEARLLRLARDVEGPWRMRQDVQRQLELLKDVRPLPERSTQRLEALQARRAAAQRRLKRLARRRGELTAELEKLSVQSLLLKHAGRIESLHDQSAWILGLQNQVVQLQEEVARLDAEIETALRGYRAAGSGPIDELPPETVSTLRRPAQVLREATEKYEQARQEEEEARRALAAAVAQYEEVSRKRQLGDLNQAIQEAGTRVSLLRKRIQLEERIDQLTRRRQELEVESTELAPAEEAPLRLVALLGLFFSLGVMLVLIGIFGGMYGWVASGWQWTLFGLLLTGGTVAAKLLLERQTDEHLSDTFRQLEQLRVQLAAAKRERDELDVELPAASGSLDARLREAELELKELERLLPVRSQRQQAEQRHAAAQQNLAAAEEALKEARHRWRNALRAVGLPEDFAPPKVKQVVRNNAQVLELRRRRDARKDELQERQRELFAINSRLQQILDDVGLATSSEQPIDRLRELMQALSQEKQRWQQREGLQKQLRKLQRTRDKIVAALRKASRARHALLLLAGAENDDDFRRAAADWARVVELKRQHTDLTLRIQTTLAGQCPEEAVGRILVQEGPDAATRWQQQQTELSRLRGELAAVHEQRGAANQLAQTLASDRQADRLRLQRSLVQTQLDEAIRHWKILLVLGDLLQIVRRRYETDRQPQTLQQASQYLARLTDGHYPRVWMPLDGAGLLVDNDQHAPLSLDVLSRGTREAVFLALRLALARSFAQRGATLPLILDDVLVNFDSRRVRHAAQVLCDFAREGHQVLMFTCHEHIAAIFHNAGAAVRTLPSRDGSTPPEPALELPPPLADEPDPQPADPKRERSADPTSVRPPATEDRPADERDAEAGQGTPTAHDATSGGPPQQAAELDDPAQQAPGAQERLLAARARRPKPFDRESWAAARALRQAWQRRLAAIPSPPASGAGRPAEVPGRLSEPPAALSSGEVQHHLSPPDPTPPAPKLRGVRRERFTWESPEMYQDQ